MFYLNIHAWARLFQFQSAAEYVYTLYFDTVKNVEKIKKKDIKKFATNETPIIILKTFLINYTY